MRVKKLYGKPYGVELNATEKRAMEMEIKRQLVEWNEKHREDLDALVLYVLMAHYGWKKKRLRKFWNAFKSEHKNLCDHYLMDDPGDDEWLSKWKLKQIGVDVKEWYEEDKQNDKND